MTEGVDFNYHPGLIEELVGFRQWRDVKQYKVRWVPHSVDFEYLRGCQKLLNEFHKKKDTPMPQFRVMVFPDGRLEHASDFEVNEILDYNPENKTYLVDWKDSWENDKDLQQVTFLKAAFHERRPIRPRRHWNGTPPKWYQDYIKTQRPMEPLPIQEPQAIQEPEQEGEEEQRENVQEESIREEPQESNEMQRINETVQETLRKMIDYARRMGVIEGQENVDQQIEVSQERGYQIEFVEEQAFQAENVDQQIEVNQEIENVDQQMQVNQEEEFQTENLPQELETETGLENEEDANESAVQNVGQPIEVENEEDANESALQNVGQPIEVENEEDANESALQNVSQPIEVENEDDELTDVSEDLETEESITSKDIFEHLKGFYKCKVCCKKIKHRNNLERHRKIHQQGSAFTCAVCNKRFTRKDNMLEHQKSHSVKLSCSSCGKEGFGRLEDLKRHEKSHQTKSFRCSCGEKFARKDTLTRHKRSHFH